MSDSVFNRPEWFDYKADSQKLIELTTNGELVMETFAHCTFDLGTSDAIIDYIKNEIQEDTGIFHDQNKPEKMQAFIKKRMKGQISPGEKPILYANTGVFSCGKSGCLVTDKKITFYEKKNPATIYYNDLKSIGFHFGTEGLRYVHVHLNDMYEADICSIEGDSYLPYGAIAALICAYAFEQNPNREKIVICKYEGEE